MARVVHYLFVASAANECHLVPDQYDALDDHWVGARRRDGEQIAVMRIPAASKSSNRLRMRRVRTSATLVPVTEHQPPRREEDISHG
jgi:hypothetical protein